MKLARDVEMDPRHSPHQRCVGPAPRTPVRRSGRRALPAALALAALAGCASAVGEPFAVELVSFTPGDGAGFGQDRLPRVVLGPPRGGGESMGSLDVLSLGERGEVVVRLGIDAVDGPGADLIVFENAFRASGGPIYSEPGFVSLSEDAESWVDHPCDAEGTMEGCAGVRPVFANADINDLDPTDPALAGGDAFDLATVGLARARFVRIRDAGVSRGFGPDNVGVDLDAVAVVNGD